MFDKSVENAAHAAAAADAGARKKTDAAHTGRDGVERSNFSGCIKGRDCSFPLGGRSTRVDFQIQPGVIDNEYLSGKENACMPANEHPQMFMH